MTDINKAAEEGELPAIKTWRERAYEEIGEHWLGYRHDSFMKAEIEELRERVKNLSDRASRQVANKAEVEPVARLRAQQAECGKEVAAKPPFPISDDEMAALRRFWECATDGEGYDVEKSMMQRLAEMGLVQRKSGAYYMATDFGLYVLDEHTIQRAAQLDGGQERSAT